ncbi:DUF3617 domain-containing protein [Sphingopyxis macrogoltabida]|uniref:DUF3617 domain-containing protein n=1 Tax=Sphingopyxis macrogoltabida TaxID=33050 RepID=A0AAC8YY41_SPHMC|nr:DUF3617 domain-containing protein [Sphingopyxis macrogoltabida]ALJ12234.1 hypothetical protein LH19_05075 [Sphingopyxis macrogoltabida]AMU88408.1 hypothetical protein ATM17_05035 [Sphingopyxis macrogoltabida]
MKKFVTVAVLSASLAVAGCGKSDSSADAGAEKAGGTSTASSSAPVKREAGNWKTDIKLVKFDMPGVPDNMKDQMAKQFAAASGTEQCVTQAQVDQENAADALSKGFGEGCTWAKKEIGGSTIDVAGTCTSNGQKVELAMNGTMAAKKTDVLVTSKGPAPAGGQMEMQMQVTSTNVGPCKA